ncbi:MAG: EAL domain-containing protein [Acidobacteriota bacterium]
MNPHEVAANVPDGIEASDSHRLIAMNALDVILVLDPQGIVLWASPSLRIALGREPEDIVGENCDKWIHPDDRPRQRDTFRKRIEEHTPIKVELRVQHADGHWVDTESVGVPVLAPDGTVDKVIISARDITERKVLERRLRDGDRRLRLIVNQMPVAVWTTDQEMRVTSSVGGGLRALGLMPDQMVGILLHEHFAGSLEGDQILGLHARALAGEQLTFESQWQGREVYVSLQPLLGEEGANEGMIGIAFDITERKQAERRYESLFARNLAGVFRSTIAGKLLEANDSFARIFGYESAAEMMTVPAESLYFSRADRDDFIAQIRIRGEIMNFEARLRRRDGKPVWALLNETLVRGADGDDILEGTIVDITARKHAEQQIEYQAFHDSLTDLPNRFLFNDRLERALAQSRRHDRAVAVLFLDLDHFKLINDTMAHSAGDELLRQLSERLSSCIRADDTVARIGGDEFVFVLPDMTAAQAAAGAAKVAEKVLVAIRKPFTIQSRELFVSASIGIAISPHDGEDIETLVKNADAAMYRAKDCGRNNYQFHTPFAQRRAEVRLSLETALRRAIERDELFLVYQPQVELDSGRISGFETLIRWNRPGFGVVEPKDFIPLAEEIGSIVTIGEWVLWTACRQMRAWHLAGYPHLRLGVNLSARQFQNERLTRMVETVLQQTGLDPRRLELEITESLSIRDVELTIGRLSHFRTLGITASLDDFGTGYSSLGHLRFLPIDSVKIDRSFITDLQQEGPERMIVQAIVMMAQSLKLRVVAEGVETDAQRRILKGLGCDEMQGYIFSRPLCVDDVTKLLANRK